jgi:Protein of unknown function (DUF2934)
LWHGPIDTAPIDNFVVGRPNSALPFGEPAANWRKDKMSRPIRNKEQAIRERAYFIWEREGRTEGRADEHWKRAVVEGSDGWPSGYDDRMQDEEKILDGRPDVNYPALLTKDVPGG